MIQSMHAGVETCQDAFDAGVCSIPRKALPMGTSTASTPSAFIEEYEWEHMTKMQEHPSRRLAKVLGFLPYHLSSCKQKQRSAS